MKNITGEPVDDNIPHPDNVDNSYKVTFSVQTLDDVYKLVDDVANAERDIEWSSKAIDNKTGESIE